MSNNIGLGKGPMGVVMWFYVEGCCEEVMMGEGKRVSEGYRGLRELRRVNKWTKGLVDKWVTRSSRGVACGVLDEEGRYDVSRCVMLNLMRAIRYRVAVEMLLESEEFVEEVFRLVRYGVWLWGYVFGRERKEEVFDGGVLVRSDGGVKEEDSMVEVMKPVPNWERYEWCCEGMRRLREKGEKYIFVWGMVRGCVGKGRRVCVIL